MTVIDEHLARFGTWTWYRRDGSLLRTRSYGGGRPNGRHVHP